MNGPRVSIIIRTRNEERWITQCLTSVFGQDYKDFEVILVDNESADRTIEKAKQFDVKKIIQCRDYLPGKALNMGVRETNPGSEFIVCLSGHCIPTDGSWLGNLLKGFDNDLVAGVYGRQEPMSFTPDTDKRDLAIVFGMDRRVQEKDSFFHNANSMIRKKLWDKMPFDESLTNIEDRAWAKSVQEQGYKIVYEPEASVYHYHGIHQDGNPERCTNVVKILESLHKDYNYKSIDADKLNVTAMIPVKGDIKYLSGKPLIGYTIKRALEAKYVKRVIVATDNPEMAALAVSLGAEAPFLREKSMSGKPLTWTRCLNIAWQNLRT
jgi:glycosyltransferase involved in cell wall biosynthesis